MVERRYLLCIHWTWMRQITIATYLLLKLSLNIWQVTHVSMNPFYSSVAFLIEALSCFILSFTFPGFNLFFFLSADDNYRVYSLTRLFFKLYEACQKVAVREFSDHEAAFPVEGLAQQQLLKDVYNYCHGLSCEVKFLFY